MLPLSRATVEGVAAALKEAGMNAGTQYLTELKLLHVEAGFEIEAWLKRTMDQCSTRAVEVRVETWAADKVLTKSVRKGVTQERWSHVLVGGSLDAERDRGPQHEDPRRVATRQGEVGSNLATNVERRPTRRRGSEEL